MKPKPALYATFYDSAYSTCYRRVTDFDSTGGAARFNLAPLYSQLQAWNRSQTLIWLASEDIIDGRNYRYVKHLAMGGANVRWDPANDSIMYYTEPKHIQTGQTWKHRDAFMKINVYTERRDTVRVFPEYPGGIDLSHEHEDLDNNGLMVVLQGSTKQSGLGCSGSCPDDSSEVFVLHVREVPARKGTVRSGHSVNTGTSLSDMQISPSGRYALLNWFTTGGGCGQDYGVAAYDTAMNYVGKVTYSGGHGDFTIDQNGREWWVGTITSLACGPAGPNIAKCRVPNGMDLYAAQGNTENDTTFVKLVTWSDAIGGLHVSGRGMGTGFVVVSADMCTSQDFGCSVHPTLHTVPFSHEIIKLYLNSTVASPKLERLADHRSDSWYASTGSCAIPTGGYWAQPHATISRDGTKIIWGSTWGQQAGACAAESYVMDISNKQFNTAYVNQAVNTWRRVGLHSKAYDGSAVGSASPGDTLFPKMDYSHIVFAPEYGSLMYFGGGGDGAGAHMGNDVWTFSTADSTWRQAYVPDTLNYNQYPQEGTTQGAGYSFRSYCQNPFTPGYTADCNVVTAWGPNKAKWGATKNGRPWSSHIYDQEAWDNINRRFLLYGPNYMSTKSSFFPDSTNVQSYFYFGSKGSFKWDPWINSISPSTAWTKIDTLPDLYHQNGASEYDPIQRKYVAINYDCWHSAGYVGLCGARTWVMDSLGVWTRKANPPFDAYGTAMVYSRSLRKMLVYPANNDTTMWTYDVAANTWAQIRTGWDQTFGHPPKGDALIAYDTKNDKLLIRGYGGNYGTWVPTWSYDVATNMWSKKNPPVDPFLDGGTRDRVNPMAYDPTNNVFFMVRANSPAISGNPANTANMGNGSTTGGGYGGGSTNAATGELWTYKLTSGDGRLFEPITPGGGGGGSCSTPGL